MSNMSVKNFLPRLIEDAIPKVIWLSGVPGRTGYVRLSRNRNLIGKIDLSTHDAGIPTVDQFRSYMCSIISVKDGVRHK